MNWTEIDINAKQWIREAGERIRNSFKETLSIATKSNKDDLVTNIDKETEQFFINKINQQYPMHKILGEEGYGHQLDTLEGIVWIIDPIDGTINFIHQQRNFAISIGIFENGIGQLGYIYDVVHDELYHAKKGHGAYVNNILLHPLQEVNLDEAILAINPTWVTENKRIDYRILAPLVKKVRGVRSYGSAALEIAYVAAGRLNAYITMRLSPWDFAAGTVILGEVGGIATTLEGKELNFLGQNSVFVATPSLHKKILTDFIKKKQ